MNDTQSDTHRAVPPRGSSTVFHKVRSDHANETAEDYVEAVSDIVHQRGECRVRDLAAHMGVSHVTVSRIITRLQEESLVETEPYRPIRLTADGERMAAAARRRHRVVFDFLMAIGVPEADARHDAEGIEHHVSDATLAQMERFVERQQAGRTAQRGTVESVE